LDHRKLDNSGFLQKTQYLSHEFAIFRQSDLPFIKQKSSL